MNDMNELTKNFFNSLRKNSDEGFEKTKTLWEMSNLAIKGKIYEMSLKLDTILKQDGKEYSFLTYAIKCKNMKATQLLLDHGININLGKPTPLECAIEMKLEDLAIQLVNHGAESSNLDINIILENKFFSLFGLIAKKTETINSYFLDAVNSNNFSIIETLLDYGADINGGEVTPLFCAVKKNDLKMAKFLIDRGANVNQYSERIVAENTKVIISHAWRSNRKSYPEQSKEEVRNITQKVTPIYEACEQENIEIIRLLLLNDADVSAKLINKALEKKDFEYKVEIPEKYRETSAQKILEKESHLQKYSKIHQSVKCLERLKLAKNCFAESKPTSMVRYLCDAYISDGVFYVDYLTNKVRTINLRIYGEALAPQYLLKFVSTFQFLSQEAGQNDKVFSYLQESFMPELIGYDPEDDEQEIKLFNTRNEKIEFVQKYAKGASWENTLNVMKGQKKSDSPAQGKASLIKNFGVLASMTQDLIKEDKIESSEKTISNMPDFQSGNNHKI